MQHNTFFILSEGYEKVTVMNRFTKEAFTRKLDKKGTIVIKRERYEIEEMRALTESMKKMKELEFQGCKPVNPEHTFFSTELRHDTHDLLFYLDATGNVNVNGQYHYGAHADDVPLKSQYPFQGVLSTNGEVFLADVDENIVKKLLGHEFYVGKDVIKFETLDELKVWMKATIEDYYEAIISPVHFGFYFGVGIPNPIFNFYDAVDPRIGIRNRIGIKLESVEHLKNIKPFSLVSLGEASSALYNQKRGHVQRKIR